MKSEEGQEGVPAKPAERPMTLWECIERAHDDHPSLSMLSFFRVFLIYPPGWAVFDRQAALEISACPQNKVVAPLRKRKRKRPNKQEADEWRMVEQLREGKPMISHATLDLTIAIAFHLIVFQWGFPHNKSADAIAIAAHKVLGRSCPHGMALSGEMVKKLRKLIPAIKYNRGHAKKHRPTAIRNATNADLVAIAEKVLLAHGGTPREWEDICVF